MEREQQTDEATRSSMAAPDRVPALGITLWRHELTPADVLALQRTAGNRAVRRLVARRLLQRQPVQAQMPNSDAEATQYAKKFAADAGTRRLRTETDTLFNYLVRTYAHDFWDRLGTDWTFDDYPYQTFTFAVMNPAASLIGVGPQLFKRIAAGRIGDVIRDLRETLSELAAPAGERQATERTFGVRIRDGDKAWAVSDLADLRAALGRLITRELTFVRGFELFRFSTEAARATHFQGQPVRGDPGALTELTNNVPPTTARISVYDDAFRRPREQPGGIRSTQQTAHGGVNEGVYVILHEFGHTIESSGRFRQGIMDAFDRLLTPAAEPITDGPQSRGTDVREKYCEAFARFHTDPEGLGARSRAIANFFRTGRHLP
jgi:hypothetical protein